MANAGRRGRADGEDTSQLRPRRADGSRRLLAARLTLPVPGGVVRQRLIDQVRPGNSHRLGVVVAPAGSGKTTLLAQVIAASPEPVAWYQAGESDGDPIALLAYLQHAFVRAGLEPSRRWDSLTDALDALDAHGRASLLVIDDLHTLAGTAAEAELGRLITYAPSNLSVVLSSRTTPAIDLARRRLGDTLAELGSDDLRFRTWEVEELFTHHYAERLSPEHLALLTRRTEGWAAGLQFFHLAIRGRPAAQRAELLQDLTRRSALLGEYLAAEVVDEMGAELRMFMVRTSPLGWLTGALCDLYLSRTDSGALLAQAERRQLFTASVGGGAFRFHEVFRRYLEQRLVDHLGQDGASAEHRRAAALLEDAGYVLEAVRAYGRGEDWASVARLLHAECDEGSDLASWADLSLPPAMAREPWAILARARILARRGTLRESVAQYWEAERAFGPSRAADICTRERMALSSWLAPLEVARPTWSDAIRTATANRPAATVIDHHGWGSSIASLVTALATLLAGDVKAAQEAARAAADDPSTSELGTAMAWLALAVCAVLTGEDVNQQHIRWAVEAFEPEMDWVAHLTWALGLVGTNQAAVQADAARLGCIAAANEWGQAIAGLIIGLVWLRQPDDVTTEGSAPALSALAESSEIFARLEAGVLHSVTDACAALVAARTGAAGADVRARDAERAAVRVGSDLGRHIALCAIAESGTATTAQVELMAQLGERTGLRVLGRRRPDPQHHDAVSGNRTLHLHCFGTLRVAVGATEVDLIGVKPRVRSLLKLLALHSGRAVHRDVLIEALWPNHDPDAATRSLQVAVSSLRQLLEPGVPRGGSQFVVRIGEGYALCLPPGSTSDLVAFDEAMTRGRRCAREGNLPAAAEAYGEVLERYTDELFPEEGAAEWVLKERERCHMEAADAAGNIGEILLGLGDQLGAIASFDHCLRIDAYRDGIWRKLIATNEGVGDHMAATRARRSYEETLQDLDVGGR